MTRLIIDKETLRLVYLRSGNQCAFPECNHLIIDKDGKY